MMTQEERAQIIDLVKKEVVPAIGCTEPMAVALAVAKSKEIMGQVPEKISVLLSANVLKNAMGVGIPGTNMIGLPIAIALGALIGKSEYQLEVLKDTNPEDVEVGRKYIDEQRIDIKRKKDTEEKLYIEIISSGANHTVTVVISGNHTHYSFIEKDDEVILDDTQKNRERKTIQLQNSPCAKYLTSLPRRPSTKSASLWRLPS